MPPSSTPSFEHNAHSILRRSGRATPTNRPYVGQAEESISPEEFTHPHHRDSHATENTFVGDEWSDDDEVANMKKLPWWKRPSPYWLLFALPFVAIASSATIAPRIEAYTVLACRVLRPDIYDELSTLVATDLPSILSPSRSQLCAADPVVQAAVAKFAAAMTTSMGVLSCLTTGWWGAFSDRYGRPLVMGISLVGLLVTDFNFIFVMNFPDYVPGGYWFLLLGPLIEGFLGGFTGGVAAIHAYQADVTDDHNRSRFFSLGLGLIFTGMAVGPTLGSLIIRSTGQLLSVFYATAFAHLTYAIFIWCILPQSLSLSYRLRARERHAEELRVNASEHSDTFGVRFLLLTKRAFAFLRPLAVFNPQVQENHNPLKKARRDWNLTFMGLAYFITLSIAASFNYMLQYAALTFGWTSEELGYWFSAIGAARAVFLALILPLAIKILKPKPAVIETPQTHSESEPLLSPSDSSNPTKKKEVHSPAFDLGLARVSILIDIVAYICMGLAPTPLTFTASGLLGSMGSAFSPATQAVTLALYTQRGNKESGKLFGALSVVQALGSQIIGPMLYGFVYIKTVATYPKSIFFVSVGILVTSAVLLICIRLPGVQLSTSAKVTSVDLGPGSEEPEGRPRRTSTRSQDAALVGVEA